MSIVDPIEDLTKLDPQLVAAYQASPFLRVTDASYAAIRNAGGISKAAEIPADVEVVEVNDDGVEGVIFRKKVGAEGAPVLTWFHGGGYIFGFPAMHGGLYLQFVEAGITVFAPKYRLTPEHPFPAPHEDGVKAWNWITSGGAKKYGVQASKFALGGTSAGGGLAASVAVRLRDAADAVQPDVVALNIPWLARSPLDGKPVPGDASWTDVKFDKIWSLANGQYATEVFFPTGTKDPEVYAFVNEHPSLHGLPPTIVSVAEQDILRDSGINFAQRLMVESHSGAELHVYRGAYHGSTGAVPNAPVSIAQDQNQVNFVKAVLFV